MSRFKKFILLPGKDKFLFLAALAISFAVKIVVFTIPLRWYSKFLHSGQYNPDQNKTKKPIIIQDIIRAVNRCSRYAPWKTKCLVDAITAKLLLKRYGIQSTLFLGVNKNEEKKLIAHAWLKCDEKFITGRKGYQKFTIVSIFA